MDGVRLSHVIMAHPKRGAMVADLIERLKVGRDSREAPVVWDQVGDLWETARRAWRRIAPGATHQLVLQDDVLPCRDLLSGVRRAIAVRPDEAISFYANNRAIETARERGLAWVRFGSGGGTWGQALALPAHWIDPWIQYAEAFLTDQKRQYDDWNLRLWLRHEGRPLWATAPSLVEHLAPRGSLIPGHGGGDRVARWFIGEHLSPLRIDWNTGFVEG